jgi:hypothetical protein
MVDKTIVAAVKENIFLPHQSEQSGMMCGGLGFGLKSNAFNKLFERLDMMKIAITCTSKVEADR